MSLSNFISSNEKSGEDPWLNTIVCDGMTKQEFEDKFVHEPTTTFQPLDDSTAYIATLERKLSKLKSGTKNKEKDLLHAVEKTCQSYMLRILSNESRETLNVNQDPHLEKSVSPKLINSWINPEQPLTIGELQELLKNDSLDSDVDNSASLT